MVRKIKNYAHGIEAQIVSFLFGMPSRSVKTIGVTGTDGKTTTVSLIFHILKTAGLKTAMISTVGAQIGEREFDTGLHTTTPSPFSLQKYIKKAVDCGTDYLVLEVTSHALDQNRVRGIDFRIGVLTNITHEHMDYHKTYKKYVEAKSKLFQKSDISILNREDESFGLLTQKLSGKKVFSYSVSKKADFTPKTLGFNMPFLFSFNSENFLAAASCAKILGVDDEKIKLALSTFKFPSGRQEIIYDQDFRVIIDFAHTPNSFKHILPSVKESTPGRLIHVFGAAGDRDRSKRPLMGEIAAENDDVIILTSEDPRSEKVEEINSQIKLGIKKHKAELIEEADRQKAIDLSVRMAKKGDTVVITGKGHEKSMNLGHGEVFWSEHEAVEKALGKRH